MAGSVNKAILVGNLGRDPEVRNAQNGDKIVTLSLATSETWKDQQGQRQERTEWHKVVIFNPRIADVAAQYLAKGAKVYVEGAIQTRKWTDQQGFERYTTEVVIGKFKGELTILATPGDGNGQGHQNGGGQRGGGSGWEAPPDGHGQQQQRRQAPPPGGSYGPPNGNGNAPPPGGGGGRAPAPGNTRSAPPAPPTNGGDKWELNDDIPF